MQVDLLEFVTGMLRHEAIQVLLLDGSEKTPREIDYGFRGRMLEGFDYTAIPRQMERFLEEGIHYFVEDDLRLNYLLFRFPSRPQEEPSCRILCVGPVILQRIDGQALQTFMQEKGAAPQHLQDFQEFYNRVPLLADGDSWNRKLNYCLERLLGRPVPFRVVPAGASELFLINQTDFSLSDIPDVAYDTIEERYRWEDAMLSAVAAGNLERAQQAHYHFKQYRLLPRFADPVRDRKNLLLTFNTLLRKAVQAGQVHPLHIDSLSRKFAIRIENSLRVEELEALSYDMLHKYCMLVHNYSRRSNSTLVRRCMDYIDFHYNEELSLTSLAQDNAISPSYLSSLFKKEAGQTLTDYIHQARIRQALILLNTSNFSIGVIAARCGFPDSNYFTRTFKKYQGTTPKAYRENVWRVGLEGEGLKQAAARN